jgi:L-fucose isomerase-like protein
MNITDILSLIESGNKKELRSLCGTWFSKKASLYDLMKRVDEQLANLSKWKENLLSFKEELKKKKVLENKDDLIILLKSLPEEERQKLMNGIS